MISNSFYLELVAAPTRVGHFCIKKPDVLVPTSAYDLVSEPISLPHIGLVLYMK
jgi:hypothetical protein